MRLHLSLWVLVFAVGAVLSPLPVYASADDGFSETFHDRGPLAVKVVDQNGQSVQGQWTLYQGRGPKEDMVYYGETGREFSLPWGYYHLTARVVPGYERFQVLEQNPQPLMRDGTSFTLVYYKKGAPDVSASTKNLIAQSDPATVMIQKEPEPKAEPAPVVVYKQVYQTVYKTAPRAVDLPTTGPAGVIGALATLSLITGAAFSRRRFTHN